MHDLATQRNLVDCGLRIMVVGGGCSGFQYGFTFDEEVNDDDFQLQKNGYIKF